MEICIAKYSTTGRIEPTSAYHCSLMLYLLRHRLLCKGLFLFFDLLSPEFVLGKTTFRSDKMNSKCGRPEISKISPKTHVLRFPKFISHLHTIYTQLVRFELPNPNMFAITKFFTQKYHNNGFSCQKIRLSKLCGAIFALDFTFRREILHDVHGIR